MATKNPTPNKGQIYPGTPEGVPQPKSIDSIEVANQLIRQKAEMDSEGMARKIAMDHAGMAAAQVRDLRRSNIPVLTVEELTVSDETFKGRQIHTTPDGFSWIRMGSFSEDPHLRTFDGVSFHDVIDVYGNEYQEPTYWRQLTKTQIAENREKAEKDAAVTADIEAARVLAKSIIAKAKKHPYTEHPPITTGLRELSLDDVERAMAETQAKVTIVGSGTLLVHAARQEELIAAIPKDAPRFTAKQLAGYTTQVHALMGYLEALGPLAVTWARLGGKRPASDVDGKQLANRITAGGVFVH